MTYIQLNYFIQMNFSYYRAAVTYMSLFKKVKKLLLSLTLLFPFGIPYSILAQKFSSDSASYTKNIFKADLMALKRKKPRQIKRIETKDSIIVYGADKLRTHIVLVSYFNKVEKKNLDFMYDEHGVIFIGVRKITGKRSLLGYKIKNNTYQFHNGEMIRSFGVIEDFDFLIAEAGRFLKQGTMLLKQWKKETSHLIMPKNYCGQASMYVPLFT